MVESRDSMELRPEEITKVIRSQIQNYENKLEASETGVVILVGDGIAKVSGMDKCMAGELVEFPNGAYGMAQNLEEDTVSVVILGNDNGIKEGDTVKRTYLRPQQLATPPLASSRHSLWFFALLRVLRRRYRAVFP